MTPSPDYARGVLAGIVATLPNLNEGLSEVEGVIDHLERGRDERNAVDKLAQALAVDKVTERAARAENQVATLQARLDEIERDGFIPERLRLAYPVYVQPLRDVKSLYTQGDALEALLNRHLTPTLTDPRD